MTDANSNRHGDMAVLARYQARYGFRPPAIVTAPSPGLGLVVAIPCHDEPTLLPTLNSLAGCDPPSRAVEVIVVINASADAPPAILARNAAARAEAERWRAARGDTEPRVHLLDCPKLPPRHAGVGLARKIAMDEAAARLAAVGGLDGVIAGLDADCTVAPNYLTALEAHFRAMPRAAACAVHFEHDLDSAAGPAERAGILRYELYLRYLTCALRRAGHPAPFHTLGSAMAVRARDYLAQGGMNRRQAGEDFHFLAKFMAVEGMRELRETTVYPAARVSHRVPFGTGRAMGQWMAGAGIHDSADGYPVYHPASFRELGAFLVAAAWRWSGEAGDGRGTAAPDGLIAGAGPAMREFLTASGFPARWREIAAHTASPAAFGKRFFRWFDRFRVLKFLHHARDHHHPDLPLAEAVADLLPWAVPRAATGEPLLAMLLTLREAERRPAGTMEASYLRCMASASPAGGRPAASQPRPR